MSLFPADEPTGPDDRESIVTNDWRAFAGLEKLSDHWGRPGWHDGAQAFYWMIVPAADTAMRELVGGVQDAVRPLGSLDLVPLDGIHLTLHRIGTVDEVNLHQIQATAAIATRLLSTFEPFELQIGPLAGSAGAIRFTVSPWTEINRLYNLLAALSATEVGTPIKGIRPHLSIAYNNRERSAAPVISAVGQLRSLNPAFTKIDAVHLVILRRDGHMYTWETLHTVLLGGAGKV